MAFRKRKLARLRKRAHKDIARSRSAMDRDTRTFGAPRRSEVETAISRLELSGRNEENPRILAAELKLFHQGFDRHIPFYKSFLLREYVEAIVLALVLALFIRSFVVQAFKIPSGSMIPTLLVGDYLVVNKFLYGLDIPLVKKKIFSFRKPKRGDIIVFRFPVDPSKDFIKRIVGTPGDRVALRDRKLYVNGKEVPREKVGPFQYRNTTGADESGTLYRETLNGTEHNILLADGAFSASAEWIVPEGKYFCMGDNRDRSHDSRFWGFVDRDAIRGKAMVIYFSWPPRQWSRIFSLTR